MFGVRPAPPAGVAAARAIFGGWATFTEAEKMALAEILVKIAPGLAAQGGRAQTLPLQKIQATLGAALRAAWAGILRPKALLEQLGGALETDPAGAELRQYCAAVAERCRAETATHPAEGAAP